MATTRPKTIDGLTRSCATALHDWVAFGEPYHTQPTIPNPVRRRQIDEMERRGLIDRNGPTIAGRKWVRDHLLALLS